VTDVKDLKVAVTTGDAEAMQLTLAPNFEVGEWGEPGDYRAFFIPTTPGQYTFHFTGTIQGKKIDRSFTSIKDGFDAVDDPAEVQYPVKDPTGAQLATRVDREAARLNASLTSLTAERDQAQDDAASARRLASIALIVGAAGLLGAVVVGGLACADSVDGGGARATLLVRAGTVLQSSLRLKGRSVLEDRVIGSAGTFLLGCGTLSVC